MSEWDLRVLSLGAGVQSSALLLMALHGEIERPDVAIFADTGWEPKAVYDWLAQLQMIAAKYDFPIHITSAGNLRDKALAKPEAVDMPLYMRNLEGKSAILRRQCTQRFKIYPVRVKITELLGVKTGRGKNVEQWFGISLDEATRMRVSDVKYITNRYPLIERRLTRQDCLMWLERNGYPRPPKSACIGCPYHSDEIWRDMKLNHPEEWADAVATDEALRHARGKYGETFLHRKLIPLRLVDLSTPQDKGQMDMFDMECFGMCGV